MDWPSRLLHLFAIVMAMEPNPSSAEMNRNQTKISSTVGRLERLRMVMNQHNLAAYIIPMADDHQTEYVSPSNHRVGFISGFTGSAGTVVVTKDNAILWTDSRYHLQAERQLDSNWTIIKLYEEEATIEKWLTEKLHPGDNVGSDPKKTSFTDWITRNKTLSTNKILLEAIDTNLVDLVWEDKPEDPKHPIYIYGEEYSGESWTSKAKRLQEILTKKEIDMFVITQLDEIAWLLNLRGNDIQYTPIFYSYSIILPKDVYLYVPRVKLTPVVAEYLTKNDFSVRLADYDVFWNDLGKLGDNASRILLPSAQNFSKGASFKIYSMLPCEKLVTEPSPIINMKAYKNDVEAKGMQQAHIKDAVALCELAYLMETEVPKGTYWDEMKASLVLNSLRAKQNLSMGPSFATIAAFGKNGALPHYMPTNETNLQIDISGPLTIDSGGQYLDGTIDTTRVYHFGDPTKREKEVYTLLLKGVADLGSSVFPSGSTLQQLDFVIRRPLYQHGLGYCHGSTHGTGVFLGVHESFNYTYDINFIGSQEPGYYSDGSFGMRLENLVIVRPADVENHTNKRLLKFEPLTLVPYEKKLINLDLLDVSQIKWINNYHKRVQELVGAEMKKQGKDNLGKWLLEKTQVLG